MANIYDVKIIQEGPRNCRVRASGILDTANLASSALVTLAQMTNNDGRPAGILRGFRVDEIQFVSSSGISVIVEWEATANQLIAAVSDANSQNWEDDGGLIPNLAAAGFTGTILLRTLNWTASTQTFTLTFKLVKLSV
jgi:hypothetical protein